MERFGGDKPSGGSRTLIGPGFCGFHLVSNKNPKSCNKSGDVCFGKPLWNKHISVSKCRDCLIHAVTQCFMGLVVVWSFPTSSCVFSHFFSHVSPPLTPAQCFLFADCSTTASKAVQNCAYITHIFKYSAWESSNSWASDHSHQTGCF